MAQEAALKEVANSKLCRLLAYSESFNSADVKSGGSALPYAAVNRECTPRCRGLVDETGVTVNFRSQAF